VEVKEEKDSRSNEALMLKVEFAYIYKTLRVYEKYIVTEYTKRLIAISRQFVTHISDDRPSAPG
jgi:hypothetical protein